jgi:hypothetical protein
MLAEEKPIYPRCWLCVGVGGLLTNNPFPPVIQVCGKSGIEEEEGIEDCSNHKQGKADGKSVPQSHCYFLPARSGFPQSDADCGRSNCNKGNVIGWSPQWQITPSPRSLFLSETKARRVEKFPRLDIMHI